MKPKSLHGEKASEFSSFILPCMVVEPVQVDNTHHPCPLSNLMSCDEGRGCSAEDLDMHPLLLTQLSTWSSNLSVWLDSRPDSLSEKTLTTKTHKTQKIVHYAFMVAGKVKTRCKANHLIEAAHSGD
jgi:hypothetical protein